MGTPDFAVPSLRTLIDNGYDVVGVFYHMEPSA